MQTTAAGSGGSHSHEKRRRELNRTLRLDDWFVHRSLDEIRLLLGNAAGSCLVEIKFKEFKFAGS